MDSHPQTPLDREQAAAARAVLDKYAVTPLEDQSGFRCSLPDGTAFRMKVTSLIVGETEFRATIFPVGRVSRPFSDFLYDFAAAVRCVIRLDRVPPITLIVWPVDKDETHSECLGKLVRASTRNALFGALCQFYGMRSE